LLRSLLLLAFVCGTFLIIPARVGAQPAGGVVHWAPMVPAPQRPDQRAAVVPSGPSQGVAAPQKTVLLPPFSSDTLELLRQEDASPAHTRIRIGLSRAIDRPVVVNSRTVAASQWLTLPNGTRIYSVQFISQGAFGIRLHLESAALPPGVRVVAYDPDHPEHTRLPITATDLAADREVWSEPIFAESAVLECEVPPGVDTAQVSFQVSELSHQYRSASAAIQPREESCENDATCYPQWAQQEAALARIDFIDEGDEYLCSGCLLNHLNTNVVADYFLTANHCIHSQKSATSIFFYWLYQTTNCNVPSSAPNLMTMPYTSGATLLANSAVNDFSFLQLQQPPANGVYYAGWTTAIPTNNAPVVILHHPGLPPGDYTHISFGNIVGSANLYELTGTGSGTADNVWEVQWYSGVTEEGSSGSPLFFENQFVIGQLYGGTSDCTNQTGQDIFGRFDVTYPSIEKWLGQSEAMDGTTNGASSAGYDGFAPGTYNGLFYNTNGVAPNSSGTMTLNITPNNTYSGKIVIGATHYSLRGTISIAGTSTTTATGPLQSSLDVSFSFGDVSNELSGTVSDGVWTSQLSAAQVVFNARTNPAPYAPRYTMVIPGATNGGPQGNGYAAIAVKASGGLTLSGSLADGTALVETANVLANGQSPMYVSLYRNQGAILGWLIFDTNQPIPGLAGTLSWIKPASSSSKVYPGGFTNLAIPAFGSSYNHLASPLITLTNGSVVFSGGGLSAPFTNSVANSTKAAQVNKVVNNSSNKLTLNIAATTGVFSGNITAPGATKSFPFHGVLLQNLNVGYGYFLDDELSGSVFLGSQ
jgi:lysyl endopeptidase